MYLISWLEDEARIDTSLGGRISVEEARAFVDDLTEIVESMDRPFLVTLDRSKAKELDRQSSDVLNDMKDRFLEFGAAQIVTIARDEQDVLRETSQRLQNVLEGREQVLLEPVVLVWDSPASEQRKAA